MPLIKIGKDSFPEWSEIDNIRFLTIRELKIIRISSPAIAVCIYKGNCSVDNGTNKTLLSEGDISFMDREENYLLLNSEYSEVILIEGRWGKELGSSGFFIMNNDPEPVNIGDPVTYEHHTKFDNHYHDFDECWIIIKGRGIAYSEGIRYEFEKGDCLITKMGDHHDLPEIIEEVHGIFFETTMKGLKREGHLWNHTHSIPDPSTGKEKK